MNNVPHPLNKVDSGGHFTKYEGRDKCREGSTVTCQKFKYNLTVFQVYHVISAKYYSLYPKNSLFNALEIAVIKY